MSKVTQEVEDSYNRVIKKFDEMGARMETTEYLIIGLYVLVPIMSTIGWFFNV